MPSSERREWSREQNRAESFAAENGLLFLKDGHCFRDDVLEMFSRAKVQPRITFESGCFLTILNMVKAGIGVSVVPEMAVKRGSGCKFIPIDTDQPVRTISLVQLQDVPRTRPQELLANFFKVQANCAKPSRGRMANGARNRVAE